MPCNNFTMQVVFVTQKMVGLSYFPLTQQASDNTAADLFLFQLVGQNDINTNQFPPLYIFSEGTASTTKTMVVTHYQSLNMKLNSQHLLHKLQCSKTTQFLSKRKHLQSVNTSGCQESFFFFISRE